MYNTDDLRQVRQTSNDQHKRLEEELGMYGLTLITLITLNSPNNPNNLE